jgi:hypothetical protein
MEQILRYLRLRTNGSELSSPMQFEHLSGLDDDNQYKVYATGHTTSTYMQELGFKQIADEMYAKIRSTSRKVHPLSPQALSNSQRRQTLPRCSATGAGTMQGGIRNRTVKHFR